MKIKFQCTLMTDVILNMKSASEGNNNTLDFIPGNVFLGIVASKKYVSLTPSESSYIFHSGKVRFGDAHPADNKNRRTLRIPSQFFLDKIKKEKGGLYVHYGISGEQHKKLRDAGIQLKQCRTGFYAFSEGEFTKVETKKSFAIKSAYDAEKRTSKENAMFGYESLQAGSIFYFTVEVDEKYAGIIREALTGVCRVGRSRTAQYGQVKIEEKAFDEIPSCGTIGHYTTIYADARLIFIDKETGMPTFQPTISDLGLEDGDIKWDLSQIRTFQYAPWNYKRQAYDTDRCGIEKGSVIVVENAVGVPEESQYIGCYNNEGFGKVIYNPSFLVCDAEGMSPLQLGKTEKLEGKDMLDEVDTELVRYLQKKKTHHEHEMDVYEMVNDFIEYHAWSFKGERFASQWGEIRSLAMQYHDDEKLQLALFAESTGYLTHGVAADKWKEGRRTTKLKKQCELAIDKGIPLYLYLVNLASQMQKLYRNN